MSDYDKGMQHALGGSGKPNPAGVFAYARGTGGVSDYNKGMQHALGGSSKPNNPNVASEDAGSRNDYYAEMINRAADDYLNEWGGKDSAETKEAWEAYGKQVDELVEQRDAYNRAAMGVGTSEPVAGENGGEGKPVQGSRPEYYAVHNIPKGNGTRPDDYAAMGYSKPDIEAVEVKPGNEGIEDEGGWFENAAEDVSDWFSGAAEDVSDAVGGAFNDAGEWIVDTAEDVGNTAVGVHNDVVGAHNDVVDWTEGAAEDTVEWLEGAAEDVDEWVSGAVEDVIDAGDFSEVYEGDNTSELNLSALGEITEMLGDSRVKDVLEDILDIPNKSLMEAPIGSSVQIEITSKNEGIGYVSEELMKPNLLDEETAALKKFMEDLEKLPLGQIPGFDIMEAASDYIATLMPYDTKENAQYKGLTPGSYIRYDVNYFDAGNVSSNAIFVELDENGNAMQPPHIYTFSIGNSPENLENQIEMYELGGEED